MLSKSIEQTADFAKKFLNSLSKKENKATVVLLKGDLGAGKTAFVKEVAKVLGIEEEITSPTFVIEKKYDIKIKSEFKKIIHIDAYRLVSGEEILALDWNLIIQDSNNLIFVEWPENIQSVFDGSEKVLTCKFIDETTRSYTI